MREFGHANYMRIRTAMASVIAAQMMPAGAVKGGTAMKVRFGDTGTRFSEDLDTARALALSDYIDEYAANLQTGWNGFTGRLIKEQPARPSDVPFEYVMQPFSIKLSYNDSPWVTVRLEVGHDEIGDADNPEWCLSPELVGYFTAVGLPEPNPIPLMPLHYQIAQKLHGLTSPRSKRAHDLVDLQIIFACNEVDYDLARRTCERLFAYRQAQNWPPTVVAGVDWEEIYEENSVGMDVLPTLSEAIDWVNKTIARICG